MIKSSSYIFLLFLQFIFLSCEKEKNELTDRVLYSPYEELSKADIAFIDSGKVSIFTTSGIAQVEAYIHLDYSKFPDTTQIDRVYYSVNNSLQSYLTHNNQTYIKLFAIITTSYTVQINVKMKSGLPTKSSAIITLYP